MQFKNTNGDNTLKIQVFQKLKKLQALGKKWEQYKYHISEEQTKMFKDNGVIV